MLVSPALSYKNDVSGMVIGCLRRRRFFCGVGAGLFFEESFAGNGGLRGDDGEGAFVVLLQDFPVASVEGDFCTVYLPVFEGEIDS